MNITSLNDAWLKTLASLRVDHSRGLAPHKPLLLLVVAGLAEEGLLTQPVLPLTGELTFRFLTLWTVVAHRRPQRPDVRLPFFHLHRDRCWTPLDDTANPTKERGRTSAVRLDDDFLACLNDPDFRRGIRRVLIARYFTDPGERAALYDLVGLPVPKDDEVKADAKRYEETLERGREARFRLAIVPAYNYTCALTGYRCTTIESGSIVDAAHIHQFSNSRNNDPRNGLALSKNAHWLFDQGLWSLTEDYRVVVAKNSFHESGEVAFMLRYRENQRIILPSDRALWPDRSNLKWHRTHVFRSEGGIGE